MQSFTGKQYLQIDIANCFGLDRLSWQDRLHWFDNNEPALESQASYAKNPILFRKAVRAWRQAEKGKPINHVMGLDATASGIQLMACLSGCRLSGEATNLVNTGRREDVYQAIADDMNAHPGVSVTRDEVKKPVMTVFYGSTAQPRQVFGEGDVLEAFYDALETKLPGAFELMGILQSYWRSSVEYHRWVLPDGHVAKVPVTQTIDKRLEIDEFNHIRVSYRAKVLAPQEFSRSLAANIVHSVDGWVVRQMVQASKQQGFWLAPIHDCFYTHPNNMNKVRENYIKILQWIVKSNLLPSILSNVGGFKATYHQRNDGLDSFIANSEYALS